MNLEAALNYHGKHGPQALLIRQGNTTTLEQYDRGFAAQMPHALFSGTKSFWGVAALQACAEGLFTLDQAVWHGASVRELLNLTAGVPFGGLGASVPTYEKALSTPPKALPGATFTYGGIALQIFGAFFAERLQPLQLTPHDFLHRRVLDRNGIAVASWRTLRDGTKPLPTGAFLTAGNWARYGAYVLRECAQYAECFRGSAANPRYGLGWWLATPDSPRDLFYASGSGGQALYVAPSQQLVAVRFGNAGSFNHATFLKRLFG